jgi:hypothetical protein
MISLSARSHSPSRDMARSVEFYERLGFELLYGGESAALVSRLARPSSTWWRTQNTITDGGGERFFTLLICPGTKLSFAKLLPARVTRLEMLAARTVREFPAARA